MPTTCSWWPAAPPTAPSKPRPGSRATGRRVVDIGKLKLDLPWNAYYDKELDVRFSRSYGPGRYDDVYELAGVDYPAGYVRWTERRNLGCFRRSRGRRLPVRRVAGGRRLSAGGGRLRLRPAALGRPAGDRVPLRVPRRGAGTTDPAVPSRDLAHRSQRRRVLVARVARSAPRPAIGFIGAGNYASSMLLPHLAGRADVELAHVVTTTSLSAANAQRRFGFQAASTDVDGLLADDTIERRLRGHPSPLPRRPGVPGLGGGQGDVRGKAAGPRRGRAGSHRRGRSSHRQRPPDGRVQPALRPAA